MSEYVLKVTPDKDLFVLYSTERATFQFTGTRAETLALLSTPTTDRGVPALGSASGPKARLDRAEATGTSVPARGRSGKRPGAFDDTGLEIVHDNQLWFLPRARLDAYVQALLSDDNEAARNALTLPPHFIDATGTHETSTDPNNG